MFKRNKRILWLLNHKTLMPYEAKLLLQLGFEVFVPKVIPKDASFRSGTVDFSYDGSLSIPERALGCLNEFNFYQDVWPTEIVKIVNRYFGSAFVIPHAIQVPEALHKFEGKIFFRAFGLDNTQTYLRALETLYGRKIFATIKAVGDRFWFAEGYEQLHEVEPQLIQRRSLFLPIGVPDSFWKSANTWTGEDKKIMFVCPNCVTNPYYAAVYTKFKADFGDLPHVIVGTQDAPLDDHHVIGFVSDEELEQLYRRCAVLYYHSTERRHVHYSPIEAVISGMPIVYFANSLLDQIADNDNEGRVEDIDQGRTIIKRILGGDTALTDRLRKSQEDISYKFSGEYCASVWKQNFVDKMLVAYRQENIAKVITRETWRSIISPIAKGLTKVSFRTELPIPERWEILDPSANVIDEREIDLSIDFTDLQYPSFIQSVTGISGPEFWGRWSVGPKIVISFTELLPKNFKLTILGCAHGSNMGTPIRVKIGRTAHTFTFTGGFDQFHPVSLDFALRKRVSDLEITVPRPIIPDGDNRAIGLGFVRLHIVPICSLGTTEESAIST